MIKGYLDIHKCGACGEDHKHIRTSELSKKEKFISNALYYTHYVVCPKTDKKVFVANINKDNSA